MTSKGLKMSATAKNKQDKTVVSEINSARSKLDGVLQTLVSRSEEPEAIDNDIKVEPDMLSIDFSPVVSIQKKGSPNKPPRKRRRKDDSGANETNSFHHTYVMKLFDRSVDLAQFGDDVPLYPVCRAWLLNQPLKANRQTRARTPSPDLEMLGVTPLEENKDDIKLKDIRRLPAPQPKPERSRDLRIPSPIPQIKQQQSFNFENPEPTPNPEDLITSHMARWKCIRHRWKVAATMNERRYRESLSIIKAIFER